MLCIHDIDIMLYINVGCSQPRLTRFCIFGSRYQVSLYRTIGSLVCFFDLSPNLELCPFERNLIGRIPKHCLSLKLCQLTGCDEWIT